jgi:hypothetical protein
LTKRFGHQRGKLEEYPVLIKGRYVALSGREGILDSAPGETRGSLEKEETAVNVAISLSMMKDLIVGREAVKGSSLGE